MKSEKQNSRAALPPYLSFETLKNFLGKLEKAPVMPNRIDKTIMAGLSGGAQTRLEKTLLYLKLTDDAKQPTDKLRALVAAKGDEWKQQMRAILKSAYPFLIGSAFDLKGATSQQVYEAFGTQNVTGDTARKAIAFFVNAAKQSDLPISHFIKITKGAPTTRGAKGKRMSVQNQNGEESRLPPPKRRYDQAGAPASYPECDPNWPDELKREWLRGWNAWVKMRGG